MPVIAGIDEAGYGPRLGPLVVSAVAFEVADEAADADLYDLLADVVGRSARDRDRVPVNDSKKLFSQAVGPRHIERTALAFAAAAGRRPATFRGLLDAVAELDEEPGAYPWYAEHDLPVPVAATREQVDADAERLAAAAGARFLGVRCLPVLVGEYNRLCERHGTKSATLFLTTARLLSRLWDQWGEEGLTVHVDKHGGRDHYDLLLLQTFFGARVRALREGRDESVYTVRDGARRMTIGFFKEGDSRHLPIALASIFCKYLRELFLRGLNAYWLAHAPGIRPTAGYAADARRFLDETADARRRLGTDEGLLIRRL